MASDLNSVALVGRLVTDPETKKLDNTTVANFSLANNSEYKNQVHPSFFECVAWGKLGEIIAQYCKKGKRIGIKGRLQQRSWTDKEGNKRYKIEVVVEDFQFLDNKDSNDEIPI